MRSLSYGNKPVIHMEMNQHLVQICVANRNAMRLMFLAPAANIVFLVVMMFLIFERPIQILFRINLVSAT